MMIINDGVVYELYEGIKCPCCNSGLFVSMTGASGPSNPVTIYCAKGSCKSDAMNIGASGIDIESALGVLEVLRANEIAENDETDIVEELYHNSRRSFLNGFRR